MASPLRELQKQYAKILVACYEHYAEGKRCVHEEDPVKRFDCSNCEQRETPGFCRANFFLKRVVKLIAEYLADKMAQGPRPLSAEAEEGPPAVITQAHVDGFRAKGMAVEIETPICREPVWLVPENTGQERVEITPEEMHFLLRTSDAFEGKVVEVSRDAAPDAQPNPKASGAA